MFEVEPLANDRERNFVRENEVARVLSIKERLLENGREDLDVKRSGKTVVFIPEFVLTGKCVT